MLTLLSVLAFATEPAPESVADPDPFAVHAQVVTLPNGLRLVVERQDRTDQLALHMHVGVGSRDELPGEYGLAHLFEHLMFEGSRNAPGNAYDTLVTGAGGENNAYTSEDETAYHVVVPSGGLERMLFLESDRLGFLGEGITDEAVQNQIDVVLQERDQSYNAVHGKDLDTLQQLIHPEGHPYHRPVIGTVADVRGFTVQGARAFHRRWYQPGNVVLGVVGPLDPDQVIERVEHWFSDVPNTLEVERVDPAELPRHEQTTRGLLPDNVDDYTVYVGWNGDRIGGPDEVALVVASFVLSDGRGTRVDRHYYKRGWIADTDTQSWASELDGEFVVSLSSTKPKVRALERLARREVQGLVDHPPTEAELDRARRRIRSLLLQRLESPDDRAEVLVDCVRLQGDPDCTRSEWARVQAVTADDVARAIRRLGEPAAVLTVVPSHDASRFADELPLVEPM